MTNEISFIAIIIAFIAEFIDSSLGMMYGTLLSPILIAMGYDPLLVVPSILLSQAAGGFMASIFHHEFKNADFKPKTNGIKNSLLEMKNGFLSFLKLRFTADTKIAFVISALGVFATIFATVIAVNIPKSYLTMYIGILVLIMGIILVTKMRFKFSWKKILYIGILSSFNKGLSGGGFGPVVTSGQIIAGNDAKKSIASTTLAEVPICVTGFLAYYLLNGFENWNFLIALTFGAIAAAPIGALFTKKMSQTKIRPVLGILTIGLGLYTIIKIFI